MSALVSEFMIGSQLETKKIRDNNESREHASDVREHGDEQYLRDAISSEVPNGFQLA